MMDFINVLIDSKEQIFTLLMEHIQLTILSVIIAIAIGVPLGILITKSEKIAKPILMIANVIQAVPSLALLGFLIPITGIGSIPAIVMVILYSLLPIIKNTYTGLSNISPDVIEAAKGIGMTKNQILRLVKIPLAIPVIMAGIRIASVTAVGLMTIAAFIGAGGLGYLVFQGIQTVDNNLILAGAIPAAILALIMDLVVGKIENEVTPCGIKDSTGKMKTKKSFIYKISPQVKRVIAGIIVLGILAGPISNLLSNEEKIVVGSKNYTESLILGNMFADLIEYHTDLTVEKSLNLGGTTVAFGAMEKGDIDVYPEYTGTILVNILRLDPEYNADKSYEEAKKVMKDRYGMELLDTLGYNNTYGLGVTEDFAKKYNLESISDLEKISSNVVFSPTIEFTRRDDGLLGLNKSYEDMNFKKVSAVDGSLRYTALINNESQCIDAFTTDGLLKANNIKILEDDKNYFMPYYAAPLIREEILEEYPEVGEVLNLLSNKIDEETMIELNYRVDELREKPENVAKDFLKSEGLIE